MFVVNEKDFEYRFGDSGPKYLMKGPLYELCTCTVPAWPGFRAHYHNVMEENSYLRGKS